MSSHPISSILDGGTLPASMWAPASVVDLLQRAGEGSGVIVYRGHAEDVSSYRELLEDAERILTGLRDRGVRSGDRVVLPISGARPFLSALWACWIGGAIPMLVPGAQADAVTAAAHRASDWSPGSGDDPALIISTSGSTGVPKLVRLTHANIIASVAASVHVNGYREADVSLNWLPLHHIGALMRSIRETWLGCRQIQAETSLVSADPLRWLDLIDEHRASMTWAPASAFAAIAARRAAIARRSWDLRCVTSFYASGEPVVAETMRAFFDAMAPHGLDEAAMRVAWGMTEACFATWSESAAHCGRPVPGVALRLDDEGELQVKGPVVAAGYEEDGAESFTADGWLRTGDLASLDGGVLTITGRTKDVVKIGGMSHSSVEIEQVVERFGGVELAAVVTAPSSAHEGEVIVVFFVPRDSTRAAETAHAIRAAVAADFGLAPRFVIPVAASAIPRSAVGKMQRGALRDRFALRDWQHWPYDLRAKATPATEVTGADRELALRIAAAVAPALRVESIGLDDDFFSCGATSLRVAQAVLELEELIPGVRCSVVDLFHAPTPLALAVRLRRPQPAATQIPIGAFRRVAQRPSRPARASRRMTK